MKGRRRTSNQEIVYLRELAKRNFDLNSRSECAMIAGYENGVVPDSAGVIDKITKNGHMQLAMKARGITMDYVVRKLKELMTSANRFGPDNLVRLGAAKLAIELLDVLPSTKIDITKRSMSFNITISPEAAKRIMGIAEESEAPGGRLRE